jgi:hypothetical protein
MHLDDFLEEHQVILQTIELNVVMYYRKHPNLVDYNVEKIYNSIQRTFEKEIQEKNPPNLRLTPFEQALFDAVEYMCRIFVGDEEFKLSAENRTSDDEIPEQALIDPVPKEVIVQSMKWVRRSINTWTGKVHGKQGYLDYISQSM